LIYTYIYIYIQDVISGVVYISYFNAKWKIPQNRVVISLLCTTLAYPFFGGILWKYAVNGRMLNKKRKERSEKGWEIKKERDSNKKSETQRVCIYILDILDIK